MKITPTALPEVKLIEPRLFNDERGFFLESWNRRAFDDAGITADFVQDNHSRSGQYVLRGLHYQLTRPQGKLVRVTAGRAYDVAVDLRRASPRFGRWVGVSLSAANQRMLWVPPGFAHGFLALEDGTDFLYKCTDYYAPEDERALRWNDRDVRVVWPLPVGVLPRLSAKDARALPLAEAECYP